MSLYVTSENQILLVAPFYFMLKEETGPSHIDEGNINLSLHRIRAMSFPSVVNTGSLWEYRKVFFFLIKRKIYSLRYALEPVYSSINEGVGLIISEDLPAKVVLGSHTVNTIKPSYYCQHFT